MNRRLVIDAGHGGNRPGVVLKDKDGNVIVREADAALATALTIKWVLVNELDFKHDVVLTRSRDEWVPFHVRTRTPGDLFVAIHYDIPGGATPIYHQKVCKRSYCVSYVVNLLTGKRRPIWSTTKAVHVGGRLYIDDVRYPAILIEVDTIDNYKDDREYRLSVARPIASALKEVLDDMVL